MSDQLANNSDWFATARSYLRAGWDFFHPIPFSWEWGEPEVIGKIQGDGGYLQINHVATEQVYLDLGTTSVITPFAGAGGAFYDNPAGEPIFNFYAYRMGIGVNVVLNLEHWPPAMETLQVGAMTGVSSTRG